jgi:hypothetical protein
VLLARFGRIEAIPDDPRLWGVSVRSAAALAESLRAHRAEAALYRTLTTLRCDVPLAEELADLRWRGARRDALQRLCREIGDEEFLASVPLWRD